MTVAARRRAPLRNHPVVVSALLLCAVVATNAILYFAGAVWWPGPVIAGALLAYARWTGLSWAQLGLARSQFRRGARWGLIVAAVVASVYAVGVAMPWTRSAFLDSRYHLSVVRALTTAFIVIPLSTVLVEEVAFRSVLWAALTRHMTAWKALTITSTLFGLWHVLPSLRLASTNPAIRGALGATAHATVLAVVGTVLFTTLGGLVAGELRRRSGSILASVGMHWATNALGIMFGLVAWSLRP